MAEGTEILCENCGARNWLAVRCWGCGQIASLRKSNVAPPAITCSEWMGGSLGGVRKVRITRAPWGWWYEDKVGSEIEVRRYPYKATDGGTIDYCHCAECRAERAGKELYEMYEVASGPKRGSIIPVIHTGAA